MESSPFHRGLAGRLLPPSEAQLPLCSTQIRPLDLCLKLLHVGGCSLGNPGLESPSFPWAFEGLRPGQSPGVHLFIRCVVTELLLYTVHRWTQWGYWNGQLCSHLSITQAEGDGGSVQHDAGEKDQKWLHLITALPVLREAEGAAQCHSAGSWQRLRSQARWVRFSGLVPQNCMRLPLDGASLPRLFWTRAHPDR